jgi:hypothetical protein
MNDLNLSAHISTNNVAARKRRCEWNYGGKLSIAKSGA